MLTSRLMKKLQGSGVVNFVDKFLRLVHPNNVGDVLKEDAD